MRISMTEPPPTRCVVTAPGSHAASIFPVSRTTFKLRIRISVILSRGAERNCGNRTTGGTDFRNSRRRILGTSRERVPEIASGCSRSRQGTPSAKAEKGNEEAAALTNRSPVVGHPDIGPKRGSGNFALQRGRLATGLFYLDPFIDRLPATLDRIQQARKSLFATDVVQSKLC